MQARRFVDLGRRLLASSRPALYPLPPECLRSVAFPVNPSNLKPVCADVLPPALRNRPPGLEFYPSSHLLSAMQARFYAAKERSRAPLTPVTSKVKKYKLKSYSSFKFRFRTMNDGQIRRWRAGKRHNCTLEEFSISPVINYVPEKYKLKEVIGKQVLLIKLQVAVKEGKTETQET